MTWNTSVRDTYKGKKPVTSWFKYHCSRHAWCEGVDYVTRVRHGLPDWLLSDNAALDCRLHGTKIVTRDTLLTFVYVVDLGDVYKIGWSKDPRSRQHSVKGEWVDLVMCANGYALEQAAHIHFKAWRVEGETYHKTLPINDVWHYLRDNAVR